MILGFTLWYLIRTGAAILAGLLLVFAAGAWLWSLAALIQWGAS